MEGATVRRYDRRVQSWTTIMEGLFPAQLRHPPDDLGWAEMQRLRGLVAAQAGETEAVIAELLRMVAPHQSSQRSAGLLLAALSDALDPQVRAEHADALERIAEANRVRNRVVHGRVETGSTWIDYKTGGGEYQAVISFIGGEEYDEIDLVRDFDLQVEATTLAVQLLHAVQQRLSR